MANNDSYDEFLSRMTQNGKGVSFSKNESEVRNNGEIYFSPNSPSQTKQPTERKAPPSAPASYPSSSQSRNTSAMSSTKQQTKQNSKKKSKKKKKKTSVLNSLAKVLVVMAAIVFIAFLIKIPIMSCVNDVLGINGTNVAHRVTVTNTLEYDEVIDLLYERELIHNKAFCKIIAKFMDFDEYAYPPGDYDISTNMGVEGMLQTIASAGNEDSTVTLTFPEGFSVDQIAEKLELNGVCSSKGFYAALASDKVYEKYDFLKTLDRSVRYRALEGYMYPDTYEFYVGEDPYSVIYRFLDNFEKKWTDDYTARCAALGYSMDDVIKIASILEKEAKDSEQMPLIASILYNRLNHPGDFPFINCDSTANYIENAKSIINDNSVYEGLMTNYNTYTHKGLPTGPISNPGESAIYAALHPDDTGYYYFLHDAEGKIYVAKTASEHEANSRYIG